MNRIAAVALGVWIAVCVPAQAQSGKLEVFPQALEMSFPQGYAVCGEDGKVLKTVAGPASATIKAKTSGKSFASGEVYLSDWSYGQLQQGKKPNWIVRTGVPVEAGKTVRADVSERGSRDRYILEGIKLMEQGRLAEALPLISIAYDEFRKDLGENHKNALTVKGLLCNVGGRVKLAEGNLDEATDLFAEEYEISKRLFGPANGKTIEAINNAGATAFEAGNTAKAAKLFRTQLAILEGAETKGSPRLGDTLNNLAACLLASGQHEEAMDLFNRALKIRTDGDCPDPVGAAQTLNNIGVLLLERGKPDQALAHLQNSLSIREEFLGEDHQDTAETLNNLGGVYKQQNNFAKAIELYKRAMSIHSTTLGHNNRKTITSMNALAEAYAAAGMLSAEVPAREQVVNASSALWGEQDARTAGARLALADAYHRSARFMEAASLYEAALADANEEDIAKLLGLTSKLGSSLLLGGDPARAAPILQKSCDLAERLHGAESVERGKAMLDLAVVRTALGDKDRGTALMQQALDIFEKKLGPSDPLTLLAMANIANEQNDPRTALEMHRKILREHELADRRDDVSIAALKVGQGHLALGNYPEAQKYAELALKYMREKNIRDPLFASCLDLRARSNLGAGNVADAVVDFEEAYRLLDVVRGPMHPQTEYALRRLADSYYRSGESEKARESFLRALQLARKQLASVLLVDERTRLLWHQTHFDLASMPCVLNPDEVAQCLLEWKGVVLASLLKDRAVSVATKEQRTQKTADRLALAQARLVSGLQNSKPDASVAELQKEVLAIQAEIANRAAIHGGRERQQAVSLAELRQSLPEGSVYIDFFRYVDPVHRSDESACYGAVIYGRTGNISLVAIPGAEKVDLLVRELRAATGQQDDNAVLDKTSELSRLLWQPIAKSIGPDVWRVLINPEGALQFLSFASLLDQNSMLVGEVMDVIYISSAHDLLRGPSSSSKTTAVLFGDPAFSARTKSDSTRASASHSLVDGRGQRLELLPLPGSREEVESAKAVLTDAGWRCDTFLGEAATEENVSAMRRADLVHIATHGFFLGGEDRGLSPYSRGMAVVSAFGEPKGSTLKPDEAMRLSGLAFAGAQEVIADWRTNQREDTKNDGLLTAQEAALLPLQNTWLVTLSACDTGLGGASSGDGVFGLRRAFALAGSENLLMTLWSVDDAATAIFMRDFYRRLIESKNIASAFASTQKAQLSDIRKNYGLARAIREAGPFALVAMTGLK